MERLEDRTAPSDTLGTLLGGTFLAFPALSSAGPLRLFDSTPAPRPPVEAGPSAGPRRTTPADEPPIRPRRSQATTTAPATVAAPALSAMQNVFGGKEQSEPSRLFAGLSGDELGGLLASVLATDFSARPRRPATPELPDARPVAPQAPASASSGGTSASAPSGSGGGGGGPAAGSPVAPPAPGSGETFGGGGSAAPDQSSQAASQGTTQGTSAGSAPAAPQGNPTEAPTAADKQADPQTDASSPDAAPVTDEPMTFSLMSEGSGECGCDPTQNTPPVALDLAAATDEDVPLTIDLSPYISDPDGNDAFVVGYGHGGDGVRGEMTFTADTITYTPDRNWSGTDEVTFLVKDGHGGYATGTITITVNPVEDAPLTRWDQVVAFEGGSPVTIDVLANDSDAEGPLAVIGIGTTDAVDGGTAVANPDGSITYTPYYDPVGGSGFTGEDFFNYDVIDSAGNIASEVVKVYVSPADPGYDDFPLAWDIYAQTYEDMPVTIDILGSGRTWDDGTVTISDITNLPPEVVVSGGSIIYTPPLNYHDQGWPFVEVEDDHLDEFGLPDPQPANHYVEVEIIPVNDAPQVAVDTAWTGIGQTITVSVLNGATDVERDAGEPNQELIVTDAYGPAQGSVCFSRSGVTYTPFETFTSGTDTFTYEVNDGHGGVVTKEVTVIMVEFSDPPLNLERKLPDETWVSVPTSEVSWSHDELRWTANHNGPVSYQAGTDWLNKAWADYTDPNSDPESGWTQFAQASLTDPAYGSPSVGEWAILPAVRFAGFENQTEFVAKPAIAERNVVAEIIGVGWTEQLSTTDPFDTNPNLTEEDPANPGGSWRVVPDKNAMGPGVLDNREVGFSVVVQPVLAGIPIYLKLFDADDPTDYDGPIDDDRNGKQDDNRDPLPSVPAQVLTDIPLPLNAGLASAHGTFIVSHYPGNNFRLVAAPRDTDFAGLRVITSTFNAAGQLMNEETQGRLYKEETGNMQYDPNTADVVLDGSTSVGPVRCSPLLTVWRRLNVEVDSMDIPPDNTQYDLDDPAMDNVPDPDTGGLAEAFDDAFIEINVIEDTSISQSWLPFELDANNRPGFTSWGDATNYAKTHRQTADEEFYWTAHVIGIYEMGNFVINVPGYIQNFPTEDNDQDGEFALLGQTTLSDQAPNDEESSFIMMEVLRDAAADNGWDMNNGAVRTYVEQLVVAHEIGHQLLGLTHRGGFPASLMTAPPRTQQGESLIPQMPLKFADDDILKLRDNLVRLDPHHP